MVGRGELTDHAWSVIEPLLPANQQRVGHRRVPPKCSASRAAVHISEAKGQLA